MSDPDLTCPRCGVVQNSKVLFDFHVRHCAKEQLPEASKLLSPATLAQIDAQIEARWANFAQPPAKEK